VAKSLAHISKLEPSPADISALKLPLLYRDLLLLSMAAAAAVTALPPSSRFGDETGTQDPEKGSLTRVGRQYRQKLLRGPHSSQSTSHTELAELPCVVV